MPANIQKLLFRGIILFGLFAAALIVQAQAARVSSITLEKGSSFGLFILTVADPDGVREFSLQPPDKFPYGGGVNCPKTFKNNNVIFSLEDFTPEMTAHVLDCKDNRVEFTILPPKDGVTRGSVVAAPSLKPVSVPAKPAEEVKKPVGEDEFVFPVAELGNCKSEDDCRIYCESPSHFRACLAFAEKYDAMSKEELTEAKKFAKVVEDGGPGGCRTELECQAYCENSDHFEECVAFAEKYDLLSPDELANAKKFLPLIKSGEMPGGCKTENECEAYCSQSANLEGCIAFAERHGVISAKELAEAKKFLPLIKSGQTPGGCDSKLTCETYCAQDKNMDECLAFAEENDILSPEELQMAKKMLPLMKSGETPGACKSRASCEEYCAIGINIDECLSFAEKQGLMTPEELEEVKKILPFMKSGELPGGCTSKEGCEAYCEEDDNLDECLAFAEKAGLISPEELEIAKKTGGKGPGDCRGRACATFCEDPDNFIICREWAEKNGFTDELSGTLSKGGFTGGPGGCKTVEECQAFCQENPDKCPGPGKQGQHCCISPIPELEDNLPGCIKYCQGNPENCRKAEEAWCLDNPEYCPDGKFVPQCGNGGSGGDSGGGPGGCKSPEECQAYCQEHPAECGIGGGGGAGGGPSRGGGGPPPNCSFEELNPVCAAVSPGKHHTFNNECFAKAFGATNLRPGVCPGDVPCSTVRDPVCAVKSGATRSYFNGCAAEGDDAGILYAGECKTDGPLPSVVPQFPTSGGQPPTIPTPAQIQQQIEQQIQQQVDCSLFASVPECSFAGPEGSQNYNHCKQCYPDK
ncbi:MAG: hypothetical protein Q7R91_00340 [bacterium]|nr:hypothetical protein [bacterium]